ncbi:MAG: hypothetical protein HY269_03770 [Deltaproteobacteria bacterium]|nr:hypothetical protein [Deltaproteobacteria bacterium]
MAARKRQSPEPPPTSFPPVPNLLNHYKLERVISVGNLDDDPDDVEYWSTKSFEERMTALEFLRQVQYGYAACSARLQRTVEVVDRRGRPVPRHRRVRRK